MGEIIQISDLSELSHSFIDVKGFVARDFDGLLMCTVAYNGLPVAYMTHPDSNYGDPPGHGLPGIQHIVSDDPGQVQCYAAFQTYTGEYGEDWPALVAEVVGREAVSETLVDGSWLYKSWSIWDAFDEADEYLAANDSDDRRQVWHGEGHEWLAFFSRLEQRMHELYPDEWPVPRP
jgi:hypothetical protein